MSLVTAKARPSHHHRHLSSGELIDVGYAWTRRRGLSLNDRSLALEIGYAMATTGDSIALTSMVFTRLGIAHTIEHGTTGTSYLLRTPEPEPELTSEQETEKRMLAIKAAKRVKLDVRLSANERAELERVARRRGVPVSTLVRELSLRALHVVEDDRRTIPAKPEAAPDDARHGEVPEARAVRDSHVLRAPRSAHKAPTAPLLAELGRRARLPRN